MSGTVKTASLALLMALATAQGVGQAQEQAPPPAPQTQAAPQAESERARENRLIEEITAGARDFLAPQKDGHLYPVAVKEARFLESIPAKIWVKILNTEKSAAVQVIALQPREAAGLAAEVQGAGGEWSPVSDGHWFNGRFLARAKGEEVWRAHETKSIRFKHP